VDRGEDVDGVADEEDLVVDEPSTGGDQGDQADPAEVEARLAADDEALDEVEDVITDPDLDPDQQVEAVEDIVEEREDRSDEGR
jgi:hypothetical protein